MQNLGEEKTFDEVVSELQILNAKANIVVDANGDGIISNCPTKKLHLPRDFYVARNGKISNLGHTESGNYFAINVEVENAEKSAKPKLRKLNILGNLKQKILNFKKQTIHESESEM